ncbi:MAG TPA: transketolase family protein [Bacillota bacterium]
MKALVTLDSQAKKTATRDAYGEVLSELGRENPDVVVLDADLSKSTKTAVFGKAFPGRFFNMGIAEADLMATAAGLATVGKIPFASTFAVFATGRAFDQVRNSICYPRLNVKIGASHAGLTVGEDGGSHQSVEDIALMRVLPNMTVIVPADAAETKAAVRAAAALDGPVYLRFGRVGVPALFGPDYQFRVGEAAVIREGRDVTIFACGVMVAEALKAAAGLAGEGLEAEVVNVSTIKPFDVRTAVESVRKTGAAVSAEEHSIIGGLGGAVAECLAENLPAPLVRVGLKDTFGESGTPDELLAAYGLTAPDIVKAAREAVARKAR